MANGSRNRRNLLLGLAFLTPNILGFLAFTLVPLVISLVLAFSNWDLRLHNMFKDEPIRMVGLSNFLRLWTEPDFFRFLGNTLFFMMGIPFGIAGSLILALLLSRDMRGGSRPVAAVLLAGALLVGAAAMLTVIHMGATAMVILIVGLACMTLVLGVAGGSTVYRTLFYLPHFTAGVAVYILWKKLYNPNTGPVNTALSVPLSALSDGVAAVPAWTIRLGAWICLALAAGVAVWGLAKLRRMWTDGDLGAAAAVIPVGLIALPVGLGEAFGWLPGAWPAWVPASVATASPLLASPAAAALTAVLVLGGVWQIARARGGQDFPCRPGDGFGMAVILALFLMVLEFVLIGFAIVFHGLPGMVAATGAEGLTPPEWLADVHWAKPAIMVMALWVGVGSNNMLLYLAGISNIPGELYEAADIDGASRFQKFWAVTWPQLAPTTFFIVIMSVIGGLQGGFEMARTMTRGGPAGATTTLSYFIYTEGFETGRLGYSSAVAWTLFLMIFVATVINWRFGNRYVND